MRKLTMLFATLLLSCTLFCLCAFASPSANIHIVSPDVEFIPVTYSAQTSAPLVRSGDDNANDYASPPVFSGEVKQPDNENDPGVGGLGEAPVIVEESEFLNALKTAVPFVISGAVAAFVVIKLLNKKR